MFRLSPAKLHKIQRETRCLEFGGTLWTRSHGDRCGTVMGSLFLRSARGKKQQTPRRTLFDGLCAVSR